MKNTRARLVVIGLLALCLMGASEGGCDDMVTASNQDGTYPSLVVAISAIPGQPSLTTHIGSANNCFSPSKVYYTLPLGGSHSLITKATDSDSGIQQTIMGHGFYVDCCKNNFAGCQFKGVGFGNGVSSLSPASVGQQTHETRYVEDTLNLTTTKCASDETAYLYGDITANGTNFAYLQMCSPHIFFQTPHPYGTGWERY